MWPHYTYPSILRVYLRKCVLVPGDQVGEETHSPEQGATQKSHQRRFGKVSDHEVSQPSDNFSRRSGPAKSAPQRSIRVDMR